MNKWLMNEWVNGLMNGWMNEQTRGGPVNHVNPVWKFITGLLDLNHAVFTTVSPKFGTNSQETTCMVGKNIELSVTLDGYTKPIDSVLKGGNDINSSDNAKIEYLDDGIRLLMSNVSLKDAGQYSLEAKNDVGCDIMELFVNIIGKTKVKLYDGEFML